MDLVTDVIDLPLESVSFYVSDPAEHNRPDASEVKDDSDFICDVCGDFFSSQRGLNGHIGRLHKDRADLKKSSASASRRRSAPASDIDGDALPRTRRDSRSVRPVKRAILNDVNGLIVTGITLAGVPEEAIDFPFIDGKSIKDFVCFSDREASIIAEGIVRMGPTPLASSAARFVGPLAPYGFGIAALVVIGLHVARTVSLFSKLSAIKSIAEGPRAGSSGAATGTTQFI